jgi:diguanylate cyclase (GGDEF)-like protein
MGELETTVALYRSVFDRLNEGVILVAPDLTVFDANRAALALWERTIGTDPRGRPLSALPVTLSDADGNPIPRAENAAVRALAGDTITDRLVRAQFGDRSAWVRFDAGPLLRDGVIAGAMFTVTDVTERLERERRVQHEADHDHVTGLANRRQLERMLDASLARAVHNGRGVAVLMIDLDGFKAVNDELGHTAGDAVLREVSERLRSVLRERDLVARYGGDEFVIVLADLQRPEEVSVAFAERVAECVAHPIGVGDRSIGLRASIGTACHPRDGRRSETLLDHADRSMYADKLLGTTERAGAHRLRKARDAR